jgi:hypothetical protein
VCSHCAFTTLYASSFSADAKAEKVSSAKAEKEALSVKTKTAKESSTAKAAKESSAAADTSAKHEADSNHRAVKKEEKKEVEKMKKRAVVAKVEEEEMQVMEEVTAKESNDCICDDQDDGWTGDTYGSSPHYPPPPIGWEGDSWSANSWTGYHGPPKYGPDQMYHPSPPHGREGDSWSANSWTGYQGSPIGWREDGWDVDEHYRDDLKHLRADIVQLIEDTDKELLPKCLRLAFHDCIDGCDGCIDMDELDNRGLKEPVELLFPLVQKYQHKLSRADVWAYCAVVATDLAVVENRPHDLHFSMQYVGRKDCKGADEKGFGGPAVEMYEPHLTTHEMIEFFSKRFGFDPYETVVLMGVHAVGVTNRENLGFGNIGREDGWIHEAEEYKLSNLYYASMLNNVWELEKVENKGIVPDRYQWYFGEEDEGPIMLTADMSLILDMEGFITTDSKGVGGKVMCRAHPEAEFEVGEEGDPKDVPLCPMAKQTRDIVEELRKDNTQFLFSFVNVLNKMITNGYTRHNSSKASKMKSKGGKGGKGRNLLSSKERDEHSTHSRDDSAEMEEFAMTHQLTETLARKKEVNSANLTQKYWQQKSGKSGKPSNQRWCSCHKHTR